MTTSAMLLPEFDQEMANTRKILELVPDDKFEYQPHDRSMTLGRLATHVAEIPGWATMTLDREVLVIDPSWKPTFAANREELLQIFDKAVAEGRAKIAAATDEDFAKNWTLRFGEKEVMSQPRTAIIRGIVMNHLVHHRAQLGVYLRLNDIAIPGMYGPSADEAKFWTAAAY